MVYTARQIKEKVSELCDNRGFEDACFLIVEGLSLMDEEGVDEYDFEDDEVIGIMES